MTASAPVFLLAGGGTGGHLFPLVAVADALRETADVRVVFAGTRRGLEARVVPDRGDELVTLDVAPIKGGGARGAARGVLKAAAAVPRAAAIVRRLRPRAVLSIGGYAGGPIALAARLLGVPLALLEPNTTVGLTNRWLAPLCARAYVAFPEAVPRFPTGVGVHTGVPLRRGFGPSPYSPRDDRFAVLVLGGSQGAAALDTAVPPAMAAIAPVVRNLEVVHQAGRDRVADVTSRYRGAGLAERAKVVPFLDDVAAALGSADVVVGRAGASSVGELCAVGRAAILVPYPFAADGHQLANARALADAGAAVCLAQDEADAARLARDIGGLARDPARRTSLARAARERGRPEAAADVARDLLALGGVEARSGRAGTAVGVASGSGSSWRSGSGSRSSSESRSGGAARDGGGSPAMRGEAGRV